MVLEGDYKELRILFDGALEEILVEELKKSDIVKYSIIPKLKVSWQTKVKHLNTHVWPGEDAALIIILEEKECYKLIEKLIILKEKLEYSTTFSMSVKTIEYLNI